MLPPFFLHCVQKDVRAKLPRRAPGSAGYDVWPLESGVIPADKMSEPIPLGFAAAFPDSYVAVVDDKSGPGFKGIIHLAGVLDSCFRGTWQIRLFNSSDEDFHYSHDKALVQVLFVPIAPEVEAVWVDHLPETARGEGGWGSTGH